ncbi:MAG: hypothetical protein JWM67_2971, partial [Mycobacterium sp.]|nr:hypothetical protein [Mycobacterium sp.]
MPPRKKPSDPAAEVPAPAAGTDTPTAATPAKASRLRRRAAAKPAAVEPGATPAAPPEPAEIGRA